MTQHVDPNMYGGFHPLFLPLDGQEDDFKAEDFRAIIVHRVDRGNVRVNKGTYTPGELLTEEDIFRRFGGGTYELQARRANGTVYARRQYIFDGLPLDAQGASPSTPQNAPAPNALAPGFHAQPDRELALITMFMQIMQKSSDDTKQMLAALMQSSQQSAAQNQQMLMAMLSASQTAGSSGTQAMSSVLGQVLATKLQPGADPVTMATKVIELSKTVGADKANGGTTDWGAVVQGVIGGLAMLGQLGQQAQAAPPPNGQPPAPQVAPNVVDTTAQPVNGAPPLHVVPQA